MASTSTSTQQELQDQFLSIVTKSQEMALDAIKSMVDSIQTITPRIPAVDMPFADRLPKPQDVVARADHFAEQLLASQRKFAEEMHKATSSLPPSTQDSTK